MEVQNQRTGTLTGLTGVNTERKSTHRLGERCPN